MSKRCRFLRNLSLVDRKIDTEFCLDAVRGLSPLPGVLAEVFRLIRSDDGTLDELATLILKDPSLVAEMLKLSNSPYFGFPEKCATLTEALQRLGMREVARLVGICSAAEVYQEELQCYRIPPEVFWESAIAAALLMERLASLLNLDAEVAYLCGLMRESGMLAINHGLSNAAEKACWDCYQPLSDWEQQSVGCDHAEIGSELLRSWGFAEEICMAVAQQCAAPSEVSSGMPQLLRLVNRILACCGCDFGIPLESCERLQTALSGLELDEAAVLQKIDEAAEQFERLRSSLL